MATTEFATRSHKGAGFLFLLGFALVATGVGFAFAPHFSWQVARVARQASQLGLENGALLVGGLVVLGLGVVARVSGAPAPAHDSRGEIEALQSEFHLFNEQVSNKLAQLRTALLQVNEGLGAISAQQQAQAQVESEKGPIGDHSQDAIFRLAASLDKLHAHFDERVHAVDLQMRSGFEALLNASHDVRRHLDQGAFHGGPEAAPASQAHALGQPQAPEGGIDFFETMQKLDAIAGGDPGYPASAAPRGRQPQAPFPSQGQGQGGQGQGQNLDALLPEEYRDRY